MTMMACGDVTESDDATVPTPAEGPTYYEHVEPILASSCGSCHTPGNVGPFTFSTYAEAYEYGTLIQNSVASKRMPPMPPDTENCRPLDDERVMTDEQRALVSAWVEAGMPEGDASLASESTVENALSAEDSLGNPTDTLTWGYDFEATPDLYEEWRCIVVDPGWEENVHLRAVGVAIDNPAVVHHIIQFAALPGGSTDARIAELEATVAALRSELNRVKKPTEKQQQAKCPHNSPSYTIESPLARPHSFASPRPLARTNETKRFPGWRFHKRTHPPNLQLESYVAFLESCVALLLPYIAQ